MKAQLRGYAVAVIGIALASILTWVVLVRHAQINVVFLFLLAVMASAWWGGFGPGILATLLSVYAVPYLFIAGFTVLHGDLIRLITFGILSIGISYLRMRRRRAEDELRAANELLEDRVEERTRQLSEEILRRQSAQDELERSEHWFRALIENSGDVISLAHPDGSIRYVTPSIRRVLGYSPEEFAAQNWRGLVHPDDLPAALTTMKEVLANPGSLAAIQMRLRHREGSWVWIDSTATNLMQDPVLSAIVSNFRDVTARLEAEAARWEGEQRLHLALEAGRMWTWDWDPATKYLVWTGPQLHNGSGRPGASEPQEFAALVHQPDRREILEAMREALSDGRPFHREFRLLQPDGTFRWVLAQGIASPGGRPPRLSGVMMDIHDRKLGEEAAGKLAAIVESSDDAMIGTDLEGIVQTWNRGAERIYGYPAPEIVGQNIGVLLPQELIQEDASILERIREGDRLEHFETVRMRKGGTPVHVSVTMSPIRDRSGQVVGVSRVARDITERKRFEEQIRQTQKLESLGVLAGGISHDFNNLLVGIMGNSSLVLEGLSASNPNRPLIEDVLTASQRAAELIRQLLAYAGKGRMSMRMVDVSELIREIAGLVQTSIPKKVHLRLHLMENLPPIEADPIQIQQIVMNLVINAAEAIGADASGVVTVVTRTQDLDGDAVHRIFAPGEIPPGRYISIEVHDSGCGMDETTKARIFDPFFTTKFTGRGLGLSAVLGIVRGHNGALKVYSEPGRGSTFQVFLPAAARASQRASAGSQDQMLTGTGTVLVIDDEAIVREVARKSLERFGYRVLLAHDGQQGIEVVRKSVGTIDLVILDLTMPLLGGEETLRYLRGLRPDVRVLLSSGFNEAEAVERFAGKGLSGFLQKPYTAAELARKVQEALGCSAGAAECS